MNKYTDRSAVAEVALYGNPNGKWNLRPRYKKMCWSRKWLGSILFSVGCCFFYCLNSRGRCAKVHHKMRCFFNCIKILYHEKVVTPFSTFPMRYTQTNTLTHSTHSHTDMARANQWARERWRRRRRRRRKRGSRKKGKRRRKRAATAK